MSGGGKQPQAPTTSANVSASQPAFLQGTSPMTMPAYMPGQRVALAEQLAAAFGQPPAAWGKALDQTHQPAKTLDFTKAGTASKAGAASGGGKAPTLDPNRMVLIDGQWKRASKTSAGRNSR